jgi:hypothetical protein
MNKCLNCGKPTKNKRYCWSCASKHKKLFEYSKKRRLPVKKCFSIQGLEETLAAYQKYRKYYRLE